MSAHIQTMAITKTDWLWMVGRAERAEARLAEAENLLREFDDERGYVGKYASTPLWRRVREFLASTTPMTGESERE